MKKLQPTEYCGAETPLGPCTMRKGHTADFHRHRTYQRTIWKIKVGGKIVSNGHGRVPLNYAIKEMIEKHDKFTIEIVRG